MKKKQKKLGINEIRNFSKDNKPSTELEELLDIFKLINPNSDYPDFAKLLRYVRLAEKNGTAGGNNLFGTIDFQRNKRIKFRDLYCFPSDLEAAKIFWDFTNRNSAKWGIEKLVRNVFNIFCQERKFHEVDEVDLCEFLIDSTHKYRVIRDIIKNKQRLIELAKNRTDSSESFINLSLPAQLSLTEDGRLNFLNNPIIGLLQNIKIDRLRFCEECNRIFWAYRLDAQTCSIKCANTLRQRKYRTNQKEKNNGTL